MKNNIITFFLMITCLSLQAQKSSNFSVLAYYMGDEKQINDYEFEKLTHIIEGFPGHLYQLADRKNFTELIKVLRTTLGNSNELSFAAGGFQKYLDESVEWKLVMPLVDRVNIMTYDLVNGYSKVTGHHTPLYSSDQQPESTDFAVQYLIKKGVPKNKLVIGAAFYARVWEDVPPANHGLYQSGNFKMGV